MLPPMRPPIFEPITLRLRFGSPPFRRSSRFFHSASSLRFLPAGFFPRGGSSSSSGRGLAAAFATARGGAAGIGFGFGFGFSSITSNAGAGAGAGAGGAAGTLQMVWHFGHLTFLPTALSGALSLVEQDGQTTRIGMGDSGRAKVKANSHPGGIDGDCTGWERGKRRASWKW